MDVVKQTGSKNDNTDEARDQMAAIASVPGFLAGYIDERDNRCIAFFGGIKATDRRLPGQQRVEFTAAPIGQPEQYISDRRQQELIELAEQGYLAAAIRLAITETAKAIATGMPAPATLQDLPMPGALDSPVTTSTTYQAPSLPQSVNDRDQVVHNPESPGPSSRRFFRRT